MKRNQVVEWRRRRGSRRRNRMDNWTTETKERQKWRVQCKRLGVDTQNKTKQGTGVNSKMAENSFARVRGRHFLLALLKRFLLDKKATKRPFYFSHVRQKRGKTLHCKLIFTFQTERWERERERERDTGQTGNATFSKFPVPTYP